MMRMRSFHTFAAAFCLWLSTVLWNPAIPAAETATAPASMHRPVQVTAEADPVLSFSVSRNGEQLAFVSKRKRFTDLWLRPLNPSPFFSLRRLTDDPALESDPVFSPTGRFLAYVSTAQDAKGDIYVIDLSDQTPMPIRITGKETADGAPCFGPGDILFFHRKPAEKSIHELAAVEITAYLRNATEKPLPTVLSTQGDAAFPAVSPDGREVVFVRSRKGQAANLHALHLKTGTQRPLTRGPSTDLFPRWSPDGRFVLFLRRPLDTHKDGTVDERDNGVLYRISADGDTPYPLTSARFSATRPVPTEKGVYFLSDAQGVPNCHRIPSDGQVPHFETPGMQLEFARNLEKGPPGDAYSALLAYHKVLERYSHLSETAAAALYAMGMILVKEGMPAPAHDAFERLLERYGKTEPEASLAALQQVLLDARAGLQKSRSPAIRREIVEQAHDALLQIAAGKAREIRLVSQIESARLLSRIGAGSADLLQAIRILDGVIATPSAPPEPIAEAMVLKGDIFQKVGNLEAVYPVYLEVLKRFPRVPVWADAALERMLDLILSRESAGRQEEAIRLLKSLSDRHRSDTPKLAMGALNRVGDLLYAAGEWSRAKTAYRQVIEEFPVRTTQTAAARFALAEILYKEQRFREALALYENEYHLREKEDRIRKLAKAGFIQKSIEGAEYFFELGEIDAAKSLFKEIIDFDDRVVAAHRGYIQCAAAQGDLDRVLTVYRTRVADDPADPVAVYTLGLALTYREDKKSLITARSHIERAILLNGRISHFHRTLGYVMEVLETVHGVKGGLEAALEAYQKAYFLTDPQRDSKNFAEISLNLGNVYFLLGQYAKAFHYYEKRLAEKTPISNLKAAVLFYKRLGTAAFQTHRLEETLNAFTEALRRIDAGIDAQDPAVYLNRNHRTLMDRIVAPALRTAVLEKKALRLAESQSDTNRTLAEIQSRREPPPGPGWDAYRKKMAQLIQRQEALNRDALALAREAVGIGIHRPEEIPAFRSMLSRMLSKAEATLRLPEQLIRLKVEMLDRLGLARQEAGAHQAAIAAFEQAFSLNDTLGLKKNLARNLRSIAFNRYLLAERQTGEARRRTLQEASKAFSRIPTLVDQYGVPEPVPESSSAWIRIDVQTALDASGATQSGKGFSKIQEKRLAEAFISRIAVELGDVETARTAINRQLAFYPEETPVSEADAYGVALLFHRAGHLAAAQEDWRTAAENFRRSARLTLQAAVPLGTLMNALNMAKAMTHLPPEDADRVLKIDALESIDRRALHLLSQNPAAATPSVAAGYHNAMGVYLASIPTSRENTLRETVSRSRRIHRALTHFESGIQALESSQATAGDRKASALLAALHLNMGRAALEYRIDPALGRGHLNQALAVSRDRLVPDIQWRALMALGRHEDALGILESATVLEAGCTPGEILDGCFPAAQTLLDSGAAEKAFNLMEKAAELERFHRLAPLMITLSTHEKRFFIDALSRLDQIDALHRRLLEADPILKNDLESELRHEQERLRVQLGEDNEHLPDFIRLIREEASRIQAVRLLGLAALAESTADAAVRNPDNADLFRKYAKIRRRYTELFKKTRTRRFPEAPADVLSLFGPEFYEAVDVMAFLPEGSRFVRLFKPTHRPGPVMVFTLTPDRFEGGLHASMNAALAHVRTSEPVSTYLAFDAPEALPEKEAGMQRDSNLVLSAAHFIRTAGNKKMFKRTVFRLTSPAAGEPLQALSAQNLPGFHVLVADTPVFLARRVPTRAGGVADEFAAMGEENEKRLSLVPVLSRLEHAACALLPRASVKDAYWIGHLFSIYGCPTLLFPEKPVDTDFFTEKFLGAFQTHTAREAMNIARSETADPGEWRLFGFPGMTPAESRAYARVHFEAYVKRARQAFDAKRFGDALILFENAVEIASESEAFEVHLSALYTFARESAYLSGDRKKALQYARRLVQRLETRQPDSRDHGEALLRLGLVQAHLEMYAPAAETLSRALNIYQALDLTPQQAETLSEMAWVAEQATEYERALTYFESSISLATASDPRWRLGDRFRNIGRIYDLRLSQYAPAIQNYEKAAAWYRKGEQTAESKARTAQVLLDAGRCYRLMGDLLEAERYYEDALKTIDSLPEAEALRAKILVEQANNAWYRARYDDAFRLQQAAWNLAVKQDHLPLQVVSLNTSGLLWWALGDNEKALARLHEALEIAKNVPHREDEVATTWNNIGMVLRETGRYEEALQAFENALAIDKRLKSRWALAYDYRHIGVTRLKMGRVEEAIPLLTTALKEARAIGNRIHEAKALLDLADAHYTAHTLEVAERLYREALSLSSTLAVREIQWRALYGLGRIQEKTNPDAAIHVLKEAMAIIESIRSNIRITRLKDGFLSNKMMVYETLCRRLADSGKPVEAFEVAERSRSRNFIDLLGSQSIALDPTVDRRLYDRYHALKNRIETLRQQAAQADGDKERRRYETLLEKAASDLDTVMLSIQAANPELSSLVAVQPIRADALQERIEPGVALLSYYLLQDEVFCWRIRPHEIRLFRQKIDRNDLGETLLDFRRRLQNLEPIEAPSRRLFDILLKPVLTGMDGVQRLGVIPHGHLHYLSFAVLFDGTDFLIDRFPVFYLPSASVFQYTVKKRVPEKNLNVLAIGNPDLGNVNLDLPFSEHEVRSIQWNFPKITILTQEKATEKWVVDNIARFGIIHLASHGEFDPVNPLLSAVKLAKAGETDGDLEAAEIFGLKLAADLVVLSACQTGLGKITAGDDVIGLNRAFLYAGTHAVISSLWRVSDVSTAMLIKAFYRRYAEYNKADSLRRAALHVKNRFPHPGYWGAFTLVGDYY